MIAYIQGQLIHKDPTYVIIDIQGVGYEIKISLHTFSKIKDQENCKLHTYLNIKEDAHTLYGFADLKEKSLFLLLTSISGVGPSTGLMVLSSLTPDEVEQAIIGEDVGTIQAVKGIGAKTAQRIILELKDKLNKGQTSAEAVSIPVSPQHTIRNEALTALVTLGIGKAAAQKSIEKVLKNVGKPLSLEELIKLALKSA